MRFDFGPLCKTARSRDIKNSVLIGSKPEASTCSRSSGNESRKSDKGGTRKTCTIGNLLGKQEVYKVEWVNREFVRLQAGSSQKQK